MRLIVPCRPTEKVEEGLILLEVQDTTFQPERGLLGSFISNPEVRRRGRSGEGPRFSGQFLFPKWVTKGTARSMRSVVTAGTCCEPKTGYGLNQEFPPRVFVLGSHEPAQPISGTYFGPTAMSC